MICTLMVGNRSAVLNDDLSWSSDDSAMQLILNTLFDRKHCEPSPADGPAGSRQAREAAQFFRGTIEWNKSRQEPNPFVVY